MPVMAAIGEALHLEATFLSAQLSLYTDAFHLTNECKPFFYFLISFE